MRNNSKVTKIFLFLAVLTGSLWTGAYLLRLFIFYWLFEPEDFILKSYLTNENTNGILYTLLPAITTTMLLYAAFIITFIIFILTTKLKFKENGWIFISTIVVLLTLPFEGYLMTIDYKLIELLWSGSYSSETVITLIRERFIVFGNFSLFYFIIFQPFTKAVNEN